MQCVPALVLTLCLGEAAGEEQKEEFLCHCIHLALGSSVHVFKS